MPLAKIELQNLFQSLRRSIGVSVDSRYSSFQKLVAQVMKPAIERHGMAWTLSYESLRDSSLQMNNGAHLSEVPTCPTSYLCFPPPKHLILYHYLLFFLKFKKLKSGSQELPQCTGVQEYRQVSGSFLFKSSHPYIPKDQSVHMKIGDHFVHSTSQGFTYPAFEEFHEIISHSNLASSRLQPRLQAIGAADYIYILYRIASHISCTSIYFLCLNVRASVYLLLVGCARCRSLVETGRSV
ncbi:hypothetical protein F5879DRAFT_946274 [Lentinula edodes]|nr:hypothetical protein F5879DRAFT_946274 [Lentinula edodes]